MAAIDKKTAEIEEKRGCPELSGMRHEMAEIRGLRGFLELP